jgi:hypothetical protein
LQRQRHAGSLLDTRLSTTRYRLLIGAVFALWSLAVMAGIGSLMRFETTPGAFAEPPARWPAGATIARDDAKPTLLLFLHPRCTCSAATLTVLESVLARTNAAPTVHVFWLQPAGADANWRDTDIVRSVDGMPAILQHDDDGTESQRFGARTSGHTMLYGIDGTLRFAGGITGARARADDNAGRQRLVAALAGGPGQIAADVFGCPLRAHGALTDTGVLP